MEAKRTWWPWMGTVTALVLASPAAAQDFEWSGRLDAGQAIEVKGVNGEILAEPTAGEAVVVEATKRRGRRGDADAVTVEVVEHAGGVTICAVYPTPRRSERANECAPGRNGRMNTEDNDVEVDFVVRVPAGTALVAHTVNGDVEALDLGGDIEAATVNGDVEISTSGIARARTVNGSIEAEMGRSDMARGLDFETVNGSITVSMPEGLHADFRASTVNGTVETDFPVTISGRVSRTELRGAIGDGGRELAFRTVNGNIRLRRR